MIESGRNPAKAFGPVPCTARDGSVGGRHHKGSEIWPCVHVSKLANSSFMDAGGRQKENLLLIAIAVDRIFSFSCASFFKWHRECQAAFVHSVDHVTRGKFWAQGTQILYNEWKHTWPLVWEKMILVNLPKLFSVETSVKEHPERPSVLLLPRCGDPRASGDRAFRQ